MKPRNIENNEVEVHYYLDSHKANVIMYIQLPEQKDGTPPDPYLETEILLELSAPDHPLSLKADYQTTTVRDNLLLDFMEVDSPDKVLDYLIKHGMPDSGWAVVGDTKDKLIYFPVERFLSTAATLKWLWLFFHDIQLGSYERIKQYLCVESQGSQVHVGFVPTAEQKDKELKHWKGFQTLTEEPYETIAVSILASLWDKNPRHMTMECAKAYLQFEISKLVSKIKLSMDVWQNQSTFTARMGCSTPYQAICLALYEKATGSSTIQKCRNPNCPNPFFVVQGDEKAKRRRDRKYCDRPGCQKYCYNHTELGLGPIRKKQKKSA